MDERAQAAITHYSNRKVGEIVTRLYQQFLKIVDEWGMLSADEIFAIGMSMFDNITMIPMERMSADPAAMRRELAKEVARIVEQGFPREVN